MDMQNFPLSLWLYLALIALTAIERLIEVRVSNRHAQWSFANGGQEFGKSHYPFMVILHTGFLFACAAEAIFRQPEINSSIAGPLLILAIACQGLRWWCISSLGKRWNTRVIIVPGLTRIEGGPYRFFSHPNYVAVVIEGVVLPLIYHAYYTAIIFTVLNAWLLFVRIRIENDALDTMESTPAHRADGS